MAPRLARVVRSERRIREERGLGRFSKEKVEAFNKELHDLVQRYLDMPDVDAMALAAPLSRKAEQVDVIGLYERQEFRRTRTKK